MNIPSVSLALPPVGWHKTDVHEEQITTVCACEKTVVMAKQPSKKNVVSMRLRDRKPATIHPKRKIEADGGHGYSPGHLTSMKYELGDCTSLLSLCCFVSSSAEGLRRSTARV